MAKKKKRKESKKSFEHAAELYGILLVLIAILGLGKYGVVGRFITSFSIFLFGSIYMLFLVSILIIGAYLVVKREWPDFFTTKLIGIYVFTLGLLILMHQGFIEKESNMMSIFKETINQLVGGFNSVMNTGTLTDLTAVGGGIIGGVFAILFDALFSYTGMQIVSWTLIGLGFLLFVGFSLFDTLKEKYKNRTPREKKEKVKDKSKEYLFSLITIFSKLTCIDLVKIKKFEPDYTEYDFEIIRFFALTNGYSIRNEKIKRRITDFSNISYKIQEKLNGGLFLWQN